MSLSNYRLKIQQGSTIYTCDLYTTPEEARSVAFADHPRVCVNIGGTTYYCGTCGDNSSDFVREGSPIAVFYDSTIPRTYHIAQKAFFNIGITASANQTITVTASDKPLGESGTGSFSFTSGTKYFPYGTTWTASVSPSTGWNAGALTPGSSGTLTNDNVKITAGAATHKTYVLTLAATTHQTITLYYKNHNGSALATSWTKKTSTSSDQKFTLGHGSEWYATIAGTTYYSHGTISNPGTESNPNTLTAAHTVSATAATHKTYTITLTQKANETVTIHYKNHNGTSLATSWSTKTSSVTLGHGSQYYCTISASTGYKAGTITSPGTASSPNTLTAAKTISFTAATAITPKITFTRTADGYDPDTPRFSVTYTNTSGSSKTVNDPSSVTIKYNTTIKITCKQDGVKPGGSGTYYCGMKILQGSTVKKEKMLENSYWTSGKLTSNTTFKIVNYMWQISTGDEGG